MNLSFFAQNIQNITAFENRIQILNDLLCNTYQKDGLSIRVSGSIGITLTKAEDETFATLYEKADQALYLVKESGRNGYQIDTAM